MNKFSAHSMSTCYFFHRNNVLFPRDSIPGKIDNIIVPSEFESAIVRHFHFEWPPSNPIYCAELDQDFSQPDDWVAISMRKALEAVGPECYSALARSYSIINWDKNHQFCGRCGSQTIHTQHSFERRCPDCQHTFYPRISPSVIVLIHRGDELLMARGHHFPEGVYGLIAGFVEAGESLEEAAHREIAEEVGITVQNLKFHSSQSWPFPDSLMVGFFAEYASGDIVIEERELETAGWYRYDNIPGKPRTSISIASQLIEEFIQSKLGN